MGTWRGNSPNPKTSDVCGSVDQYIIFMHFGQNQSLRLTATSNSNSEPTQNERHLLLLQQGETFFREEEFEAAEDSLRLLMEKINVELT